MCSDFTELKNKDLINKDACVVILLNRQMKT